MALKRGVVVTVSVQGDYGKPRPAVVVQPDAFLEDHPSVTVLPITSELHDAPLFRVTVDPSASNGLRRVSQVMVDKPITLPREKLGRRVGTLGAGELMRVSRGLALWLGIATG